MNLTYEFSQQELSIGGLDNFQMLYGLDRLKAMVTENPKAGYRLRGSLEILVEEDHGGVSLQECPRVAHLCARLFEETPIAFLAAPNALMSAEIFWATLANHTRVDWEEMDGKIVYTANSKRRWKHTQRFRAKIFEQGAALGVSENYCNEHFAKLITGADQYAREFQFSGDATCSPWRMTPEAIIMHSR